MTNGFTDNPTAWMDWTVVLGYIGFMVFIAYQVLTRSTPKS
ncbi:MAG: hypothetical protein AAFR31_17635 [Cyanobacteria bacterium J06627_8]